MSDELPPLEDALERALQAERDRPVPSSSTPEAEAVLARVLQTIAIPTVAPNLPIGGTSGPAPGPSGATGMLTKAAWVALSVGVGAVGGATLHAALAPTKVEIRTVERTVERIVERVVPAPAPPEAPDAGTHRTAVEPHALDAAPQRDVPSVRVRDRGLERETSLVSRAQVALQRGEPALALEALAEHARVFPHGALVEEREALSVVALARSGQTAAAITRARRFHARYPSSPLGTTVDTAVQGRAP